MTISDFKQEPLPGASLGACEISGGSGLARVGLTVQGRVQGVGFRPFVWRLATELGLSGYVRNTSSGVRIEIQGDMSRLLEMERRLRAELPPLADISDIFREELALQANEDHFSIHESTGHAGQNVLVSPDIGVCDECLEDIRDPANARHGYAFTNCVNCGPRYTITKTIPYDRKSTVMDCFTLCKNCASEYADPANRRFHAQPIACASCGPTLWYVGKEERNLGRTEKTADNAREALARAARDILAGKIVAIKGLGGFQLACDARDERSVSTLRKRKNRPHKALALMVRDVATVRDFCLLEKRHVELLTSPGKPIVLCPKLKSLDLLAGIAPDAPHIGFMLPSTPLHALLLDWLHGHGMPNPALVMTSANPAGEPICLGNREALARLADFADSWLLHDRDILVRVDDSVAGINPAEPSAELMIRRARGYVPTPMELAPAIRQESILGTGGDLKSAFCLTRGDKAFTSQHIGDLSSYACMNFFEESLAHIENLLECRPALVVHDLHPDFSSARLAKDVAQRENVPAIALQHHAAHAASVLAENMLYSPALALCLDGTGLGTDGNIWGGELLLMDLSRPEWQRVGSMAPFPLPGGEKAIKEPWRIAFALNFQSPLFTINKKASVSEKRLLEMLERNINCPSTSSCGRLFDAVSAQLGLCPGISYEGQAAMRLMNAAWINTATLPDPATFTPASGWLKRDGEIPLIKSQALFEAVSQFHQKHADPGLAAALFHHLLADALAGLCLEVARSHDVWDLGLSGGVFQNSLLVSLLKPRLLRAGLRPHWHGKLPPGDGGIAFGQAVWGRQLLNSEIPFSLTD